MNTCSDIPFTNLSTGCDVGLGGISRVVVVGLGKTGCHTLHAFGKLLELAKDYQIGTIAFEKKHDKYLTASLSVHGGAAGRGPFFDEHVLLQRLQKAEAAELLSRRQIVEQITPIVVEKTRDLRPWYVQASEKGGNKKRKKF